MPEFVFITGPQAVGKMGVGEVLADQLGYSFSHNHHSIELGLELYEYGTEPFKKIREGIRRLIFDTMIEYEVKGFIFTYMTAFNERSDLENVAAILDIFRKEGWMVNIVELEADLQTRIKRNRTASRLESKPSKRDVEASEQRLIASLDKYVLNTSADHPIPYEVLGVEDSQYFKLNNSELSIADQVDKIINYFQL